MRSRLSSDTLLLVAVLLLTLGIAIFAVRSGRSQEEEDQLSTRRTTYSAAVGGYQALFETMVKLGYPVQRWRSSLEALEDSGTLIVASPEPGAPITPEEWRSVADWVARGNLMVFLADRGDAMGAATRLSELFEATQQTSRPVQPSPPAAAAPELRTRAAFHLDPEVRPTARPLPGPPVLPPSSRLPLYRDESGTTVTYARWGRGAVVLCSSPWSLSTVGVDKAGNFPWLLATIAAYGPRSGVQVFRYSGVQARKVKDGPAAIDPEHLNTRTPEHPNTIFFDEYHHGYGAERGILSLLAPIARLGLAQLAVAGLLLVYTVSRRFGRLIPDESRVRRSRSEYLSSMASLLRRARAVDLAVSQVRGQFLNDAHRSLGLPRDAAESALLAAAATRGVDPERLRGLLERANRLTTERDRTRQDEAVAVARELVHLRRRLAGERLEASDAGAPLPMADSPLTSQHSHD